MNHLKQMLMIRLEDLVPSPYNVRRYSTGQVEELAALIASQGLLQNLIVTDQIVGRGKRQHSKFGVVAGERRRRAMALLQQRGTLAADHEVLCELVDAARAMEISLAENSGREQMHPADECDAFRVLIEQGRGIEDVAARFGVSTLVVQRRLKLAALSPKLLALYREDGINLDQLMALSLTDDHALQERVWFESQTWERSPPALRKRLTAGEVLAHQSALARFVGLEAYEAAGGIVRRDLFDSEQSCWIADAELLRRLAEDKLNAEAASVRAEGWAWVEARLELETGALRDFARAEPGQRALTADERRLLAELDRRVAELDAEQEALDDEDTWTPSEGERIQLELQDIEARQKAVQVSRQVWREEDRARHGVIVTVGRDGSVEFIRGLARAADKRAGKAAQRAERGEAEGNAYVHAAAGNSKDEGAAAFSDTLLRRLAAHRTAALQAVLAQGTGSALVALTHALAVQVFDRVGSDARSALQISARPPKHDLLRVSDDLPASRAWVALEQRRADWVARLPQDTGEWLGWLAALPMEELLDLLGLCAASLALVSSPAVAAGEALAKLVDLDMRQWWEPTPEAFLNHVSKAQIAEAMKEGGVGPAATEATSMKKGELVALAAQKLAGRGWLPGPLHMCT